jgi:hypothetical protein
MSYGGTVKKNPDLLLSIVSFLIPMIGFIMGVFFIIKPNRIDKNTGMRCLSWALAGSIFGSILFGTLVERASRDTEKGVQKEEDQIEEMFKY